MSNKLPPNFKQTDQKASAQQHEMQRQSFILNTRLRLAEAFLNTLIGRADVDLTADGQVEALADMSIETANTLMIKLGLVVPATNVE